MLSALLLALAVPCLAQTNGGAGSTLPGTCIAGSTYVRTGASAGFYFCSATNTWTQVGGGSSEGVPAGANIVLDSGTCPAGYTENTALSGKALVGTVAANGNVGQSVGSDSITSVVNHTHTVSVTDPGHTHVERILNSGTAGTVGVQGASAASNANASNSPTASATTGITATTANPAGGVASIDNRQASIFVIVCKKT